MKMAVPVMLVRDGWGPHGTPFRGAQTRPSRRGIRRWRDDGGTVLMESVLVLPLLLFLITGIFQMGRFWQARLFTQYAAYNAARAALVYNPREYKNGTAFKERDGVAWLAALATLAWVADGDPGVSGENYQMPGWGVVPRSADLARRVRIVPEACREENGWVQVTVEYDYPTVFAVYDPAVGRKELRSGEETDNADRVADASRFPHFTFREKCLLPKPWSTERFPSVGEAEWNDLHAFLGGS